MPTQREIQNQLDQLLEKLDSEDMNKLNSCSEPLWAHSITTFLCPLYNEASLSTLAIFEVLKTQNSNGQTLGHLIANYEGAITDTNFGCMNTYLELLEALRNLQISSEDMDNFLQLQTTAGLTLSQEINLSYNDEELKIKFLNRLEVLSGEELSIVQDGSNDETKEDLLVSEFDGWLLFNKGETDVDNSDDEWHEVTTFEETEEFKINEEVQKIFGPTST